MPTISVFGSGNWPGSADFSELAGFVTDVWLAFPEGRGAPDAVLSSPCSSRFTCSLCSLSISMNRFPGGTCGPKTKAHLRRFAGMERGVHPAEPGRRVSPRLTNFSDKRPPGETRGAQAPLQVVDAHHQLGRRNVGHRRMNLARDQFEFATDRVLKKECARIARTRHLPCPHVQKVAMRGRQNEIAQLAALQHRLLWRLGQAAEGRKRGRVHGR